MRRSMNGTRTASSNASAAISKQVAGRRATATDENNGKLGGGKDLSGDDNNNDNQHAGAGPVTARLKSLEKKYSQLLEMQAKFNILDKWIQQQFSIKLFPSAVVNMDKFSQANPEDVENPFYAVYLVCQRVKFLEEKVKRLETRPFEDFAEPKPTSNYSSAHAFRNFKTAHSPTKGGVKRAYVPGSPSTPKKPKLIPRPAPASSNYPLKPSVKILPKDPNTTVVKKEPFANEQESISSKNSSPSKQSEETIIKVEVTQEETSTEKTELENVAPATDDSTKENESKEDTASVEPTAAPIVKIETDEVTEEKVEEGNELNEGQKETPEGMSMEEQNVTTDDATATNVLSSNDNQNEKVAEVDKEGNIAGAEKSAAIEDIPILEDATAPPQGDDDNMDVEMEEDGDMEVEQKPDINLEEETGGGDVSGSEASVSSLASSSSKVRSSTRRRQGAAATAMPSTSTGKASEEEKPVMYTARGRRHTVPRRYAEFTGHDNVVSILKSQQRAEKSAAAAASAASGSKGGKRQTVTSIKSQDTPPKIKKMVKTPKTPSPKKAPATDSEGDGDGTKKGTAAGTAGLPNDRPPCVDALVDRVMAREVDSDGMVVLSESYPNIYVNQQQLVTVIVRSNGKSTRLTRKMTTLVFEDSVLASASPFGTKYYKDRLPPEPLEAMVDFIADSGFEPHYSKKKIYMIVGQVCNEARAGRVSRKFMQPLEATPEASGSQSQEQDHQELEFAASPDPTSQPSSQ